MNEETGMPDDLRLLPPEYWPPKLHHIADPPKRLWIRGTAPSPDMHWLCVVGPRHHSEYGAKVCEHLIGGLAGYPIGIVSGLAFGIDSLAHECALEHGLPTIAVPGSGLNDYVIYPRARVQLARRILNSGNCLISEYDPDTAAAPWTFPRRNRIMASLADAVLIIEGSAKSGTLITARLALDYGRDVCIVPGSIFSELSIGPLSLLRDGATPVTCAADILQLLGISPEEKILPLEDLSEIERAIMSEISKHPQKLSSLIEHLDCTSAEISQVISLLELKGFITNTNGQICQK